MKFQIGVIGSAEDSSEKILYSARIIGREIARYDCTLITGAVLGVSYEAVLGSKELGGLTIGIAPALNEREQIERFKLKQEYLQNFDAIIFTGAEYKGRNVTSMRSCHGVVVISGGFGTLNEYTIAHDEGKTIAVLSGSGGVADHIPILEKTLPKKKSVCSTIYNENPKELVKDLVENLRTI